MPVGSNMAVWPSGRFRPGDRAAGADGRGLFGVGVVAGEGAGGNVCDGEPDEVLGEFLESVRDLQVEGADSGTAKCRQVTADTEIGAEVASQGTDVGAAGAVDGDVEVDPGLADADVDDVVAGHRDCAGLERDLFAGADAFVRAFAVDLDRGDRRRDLRDLPRVRRRRGPDRVLGDTVHRGGRDDRALGVVGGRHRAEADRGVVRLVGQLQMAEQPGRAVETGDQDAGRHRVQRAGMAHLAGPCQPPDLRDDRVRGHPRGFVDHDDAVRGRREAGHWVCLLIPRRSEHVLGAVHRRAGVEGSMRSI